MSAGQCPDCSGKLWHVFLPYVRAAELQEGRDCSAIDSRACACLKIFFSRDIKGLLLMIKSPVYLHVEAQGNLEMIFKSSAA